VVERTGEVAGLPTHWREAPGDGRPPILYLHGVPTASWEWLPFLERIGGVAPDLPGFGRSAKPDDFDYSIEGYQPWLESFIDSVGLDRFSLVVNDWGGGLGLLWRSASRIESTGSSSIPRFRSFPATAGTGSRASGERRGSASCSWQPRASGPSGS
jgi:pimeloyl-ACP methyl ester carboxylesterase